MEIAILIEESGAVALLQEADTIQVYHHHCGIWEVSRSMPLALPTAHGLPGLRRYMQTVVEFLGECRTLVGLSVIGLPFFELEKAGFTIWELPGSPLQALDHIRAAEDTARELPAMKIIMPSLQPREISPGCYTISIKDIQNCNGKITSKQILYPLLKKMDFHRLEVICSHVPPWLEQQIITGQLTAQIIPINQLETSIIISGDS